MAFCDRLPPTVAVAPESGPQNGVRTPCGSSAARSACHVQPTSTVTYMSAVLTSTTCASPRVSIRTHASRGGTYPPVYEEPPPRGTTACPADAAAATAAASSATDCGCTTQAATCARGPAMSWEKNCRSSSEVRTRAAPTMVSSWLTSDVAEASRVEAFTWSPPGDWMRLGFRPVRTCGRRSRRVPSRRCHRAHRSPLRAAFRPPGRAASGHRRTAAARRRRSARQGPGRAG